MRVDALPPRRTGVVNEDIEYLLPRLKLGNKSLNLLHALEVRGKGDAGARAESSELRRGLIAILGRSRGNVDL